ncbi:MAG: RluA family pseudouridine synthase [Bacilli bacterium]|nr:RluA family pseudouridine synthase [Bacilli bacterium]
MINIIYEDNHILVVEKPINMPVCEDESKDQDLLNHLKKYLKKKYNKPGNVYLALIHRLDRPVGGIMVFAKTSKAASRLNNQIKQKKINKKYYAVLCGELKENGKLVDKLYKDTKTNMVTVNELGKESILEYTIIKIKNNLTLTDIKLVTGRPHQIRVQFSSRGYPLYGDQRYNKNSIPKQQIALYSYYLSFTHPTTKEILEFKCDLPKRYPFTEFIDT